MDDFLVAVVARRRVAMLNVHQHVAVQREHIRRIAEADAHGRHTPLLLAAGGRVNVDIAEVGIDRQIAPLRVTRLDDGEVVIAAAGT